MKFLEENRVICVKFGFTFIKLFETSVLSFVDFFSLKLLENLFSSSVAHNFIYLNGMNAILCWNGMEHLEFQVQFYTFYWIYFSEIVIYLI